MTLPATTHPVYPEPAVPKNPVLGWNAFRHVCADGDKQKAPPTVLDLPHIRLVTSARIAIALALRKMNIGAGDEVLIPDYHCLSMVEPVTWSGATAQFYSLTERLDIALEPLARADLSRVKAIVVTHYFGFPQPMRSITAFCAARGIRIIEDCAHALFGYADGQPIGSWGDYAAASLMKFFPVYDGGCLASAHHALDDIVLQQASKSFQAKTLMNTIERGLYYRRFPGMQSLSRLAFGLKDGMWASYKRLRYGIDTPLSVFEEPAASNGRSGLDVRWLDRSMSLVSQALLRGLPRLRIAARRQHNYRRLARELRALPGVHLLFPDLPDDVVPYVFPLLIDRPEMVFDQLKRAGLPLFRWDSLSDELDPAIHVQALRYATGLFQIPCHQELTDADLDWMILTLQQVMNAALAGPACAAAVSPTSTIPHSIAETHS